MKQLFLTLMLTCIYIGAKAQQSLSYAYDAAGNRISRTIILETRASMAMEEKKDSVFFEEMLAEKQLKIYPNPVEQQLNIAVDEYSSSLDGFFDKNYINFSTNILFSELKMTTKFGYISFN